VIDSFTEVESGKVDKRPELQRALRMCELTNATLIIAKLDRLSRDIAFIANLQKSEVSFLCVDLPEANTLTIGMMAVLAQYERELISERTKEGLKAASARGVVLGNSRLYECRNTCTKNANIKRAETSLARNTKLRETIEELRARHYSALSLSEIAEHLNASGYTTARGCLFTRTQIHRILKQKTSQDTDMDADQYN